jgi:Core-2/I-Branching enzyme
LTRIAYIISAYKLPDQLVRLVRRLDAPGTTFVVHVDRKTPRAVYEEMVAGTRGVDITFVPRHVSHWGGWGHVRATLKGIEQLYRGDTEFDYAVLLTGQDYPLRSPAAIAAALGASGGRSFMSWWPLPFEPWGSRGGLERFEDWHVITYGRRHLALPLRRKLPQGLSPFGGGAYWCFARPLVDYVHGFVARNPDYVRFFRHVLIPDELFFQTLIMNSALRDTVVDDNLRYVDWFKEPGPAVLTVDDLDSMLASGKFFARKFDTTVDAAVLDRLDELADGSSSH